MRVNKYYCRCGAAFTMAKFLRQHRNDCNNSLDTVDVGEIHQEVSVSEWYSMKNRQEE